MDAFGLPRSPSVSGRSDFDIDQALAEEEELERERTANESARIEDYMEEEEQETEGHGASGAADADEEEHDYEYEEDNSPVLGEASTSHAPTAGPSRPSNEEDFTGPWQQQMQAYRHPRARPGPEPAAGRSRKSRRIAPSEDGDGLDDRVERVVSGRPQGAGSVASSHDLFGNDDDSDDSGNAAATANGPVTYVDARSMGDYNPTHFGYYLTAKIPEFRHGSSANSTWMTYTDAKDEVEFMCPVRALCWNIPAELFSFDSTRFRHWTTPEKNPIRASNIASVLSFCFTGTSKGFL
jgi:hypothetical protein